LARLQERSVSAVADGLGHSALSRFQEQTIPAPVVYLLGAYF
jgi:hypothetical protein